METRYVLITGASSGMGKATAILLAKSGYTVFAGTRKQAAVDQLLALRMPTLIPIILDVTQPDDITSAYATIEKVVGNTGLNALINNAGNNYVTATEHLDEAKARHLFETHFWGMAKLAQAFIPLLRLYAKGKTKGARLINVGSVGSLSAFPFIQFYNAAKFAILGFTESLRFELASQGIQSIAILPGSVKTDIWQRSYESIDESLAALPPTGVDLYRGNLMAAGKLSASMERIGVSSDTAALVFKEALEARNPRLKYFIGNDAKAVNVMVKFLPDRFRHWIIRRQLKF